MRLARYAGDGPADSLFRITDGGNNGNLQEGTRIIEII